jgi:hypothetical protein
MSSRRRWEPEGFGAHLVAHPLLQHITRRLVWGVYAPDRSVVGTFRVAEDLSYADVHDAHYEIPEGTVIGVAHPVELGTALAAWGEVFADYELLQPFDQLGRPALELTAAERSGRELLRFYPNQGVSYSPVALTRLDSRGWISGPVGDPPVWSRFLRPLGDDLFAIVDVEPGLIGGPHANYAWQRVERAWLSVAGADASFDLHSVPWSELGAAAASEVLSDLTEAMKW